MDAMELNGGLIAWSHCASPAGTVVFVNPAGCDQRYWDGVRAGLDRGLGTLTFDHRGQGLSSDLAEGATAPDLALDLLALLEHAAPSKVVLVGDAEGAALAMLAAGLRPDMISALVLTAPTVSTRETSPAGWLSDNFMERFPVRTQLLGNMVLQNSRSGADRLRAATGVLDLQGTASQVKHPVSVVSGRMPLPATEAMSDALQEGRLITLDTDARCLPVEVPDDLARIIGDVASPVLPRSAAGDEVRRSVLGDEHVERARAQQTEFDNAFQSLITEGAWGTVWASNAITRRERSMITLALLAALGNYDEIPMHIRAAAVTGANRKDIEEAFQHVAVYAGVPRANHAIRLAKEVFREMDSDD